MYIQCYMLLSGGYSMNYIVYVTIRNVVYQYPVTSLTIAQEHVVYISKYGYRHFEGNLCAAYRPDQVRDVRYITSGG